MIKRYIGILYYIFNKYITQNDYKTNLGLWFWNEGDKTLLINHKLNKNSIVFDVGGYIGVFTDNIINKYNPNIYIFEPVPEYYNILEKKYQNNPKAKVFQFGLSNTNHKQSITYDGETSSVYKETSNKIEIELKDIVEFTNTLKLNNDIDLISMNIEGGEYDLLDQIIDSGMVNNIITIQVQFHNFVTNASQKRSDLIQKLKITHEIKYTFPFVWDCFERKTKA